MKDSGKKSRLILLQDKTIKRQSTDDTTYHNVVETRRGGSKPEEGFLGTRKRGRNDSSFHWISLERQSELAQ